jgi:hypothetical protein
VRDSISPSQRAGPGRRGQRQARSVERGLPQSRACVCPDRRAIAHRRDWDDDRHRTVGGVDQAIVRALCATMRPSSRDSTSASACLDSAQRSRRASSMYMLMLSMSALSSTT